jgi:hypothetical protein
MGCLDDLLTWETGGGILIGIFIYSVGWDRTCGFQRPFSLFFITSLVWVIAEGHRGCTIYRLLCKRILGLTCVQLYLFKKVAA